MRRTLYLLTVLMVGAVSAASAQVHPSLAARIDNSASNPHGLLVHVSGLLDDPEWLDQLSKGYTIQLHWTVQLWRSGLFGAQPKSEWDTEIQSKTTLVQYSYTTKVPGRPDDPQVFSTLDSLKAWLSTDVPVKYRARLDPGDWYYKVWVDISTLTPDDLENREKGGGNALAQLIQHVVVGGGKTLPLSSGRITFKVPKS